MKYASPQNRAVFNQTVWQIVRQIPSGNVATYGQIAALIPPPPGMSAQDYRAWGARWVGSAMAACPEDVPWQRVVNSQGKVSLRPGGGYEDQRQLLEGEGVVFDERERIDLKHYQWAGPGVDWLRQHQLLPPQPAKGDG
jgi:methylated-DNA-protein-cysteine methyltransferase-like protein